MNNEHNNNLQTLHDKKKRSISMQLNRKKTTLLFLGACRNVDSHFSFKVSLICTFGCPSVATGTGKHFKNKIDNYSIFNLYTL